MKPSPTTDKAFSEAHARFKSAEQHVADLNGKLETANAKLLQARMDSAAVEREIEAFASNMSAAPDAAASLLTRQGQLDNLCRLLERSGDFIEQEIAKAKVAVLEAEAACLRLQRDYHDRTLAQMVDDFLRANATTLQKMTQAMYCDSLFSGMDGVTSLATARQFASRHVEVLFSNVLPDAVARVLGNDDAFRAGCIPTPGQPLTDPARSPLIDASERAAAGNVGARSHDDMVKALLPREPAATEPLNYAAAMAAARQAAASAESNRHQAQVYRERLRVRPGDESLVRGIEEHEARAKHFDGIVAAWDERIQAHQAAQQ